VIAKRTGAKIIANGEAIRCMRDAGVPDDQLIPIAGGEQFPLGDKGVIVRPFPALHCLMTFKADHSDVPDVMDTGKVYARSVDSSRSLSCRQLHWQFHRLHARHHQAHDQWCTSLSGDRPTA
jgi:hypothetical protein